MGEKRRREKPTLDANWSLIFVCFSMVRLCYAVDWTGSGLICEIIGFQMQVDPYANRCYIFIYFCIYLFIYVFIYISIYLCIYLSTYLFMYLFI